MRNNVASVQCTHCNGTRWIEPHWPVGPGGAPLRGYQCPYCKPSDQPPEAIHFDEVDVDYEPEDEDPGDECGRWNNGRLGKHCSLAGTEFCDWECPYS